MRLAALALLLLACSAPAEQTAPEQVHGTRSGASCPDLAWGGWDESAECAEAAQRIVAGADRACRDDRDCTWVGSECDPHGVAAVHGDAYRSWPGPCADPVGGQCPAPCGAVCRDGCCEAVAAGCD